MDTTVIVALISAGSAITVCAISNYFQNKTTRNLIEYRVGQLERKVDKHNSVIERTYELEKLSAVREEEIDVINHRIKDLEANEQRRR